MTGGKILLFCKFYARLNLSISKPIPIDDKKVSTRTHVVKSGDSLGSIAQKYAVSVDDIVALNPQITDRNMIFLGQVIVIP